MVAVFIFEENAVVFEDRFKVGLARLLDNLLVLFNFLVPFFNIHGKAIGSISWGFEVNKISENKGHIGLVGVLRQFELFLELGQKL